MSIDPKYFGLIEGGMTFLFVVLFTAQQLWSLRDKPEKDEPPPADAVSPPDAGEPP